MTEIKNFIDDSIKMANSLVPLYASTYTRAYLIVKLEMARGQISTLLESAVDGYEDDRKYEHTFYIKDEVMENAAEARCAAAEAFLLLLNEAKYANHDVNWLSSSGCIIKYKLDANKMLSYRTSVNRKSFLKANEDLYRMIDVGREVGFSEYISHN